MAQLNPKHAVTAVAGLEAYIAQLEQQKREIDQKIAESQEALRALQRQCQNGTAGRVAMSVRRKKGENLRQLREVFQEHGGGGWTVGELSAALNVPQSSIQNVLRKNPAEFEQGADGLWRQKGVTA